jgi:hypothetical protein
LRLEAAHACRSSKSCTGRCPILPAVKREPWGREGDNGATASLTGGKSGQTAVMVSELKRVKRAGDHRWRTTRAQAREGNCCWRRGCSPTTTSARRRRHTGWRSSSRSVVLCPATCQGARTPETWLAPSEPKAAHFQRACQFHHLLSLGGGAQQVCRPVCTTISAPREGQ